MKLILTISAMILFLITGCESGKQPANDFLTVDITANYPKKELILQPQPACKPSAKIS